MISGKWHLRSEGYMKPGCDYQEIAHMKANRAIEHGDLLVFTKKDGDGNVLDERVYLSPRHGGTQWRKLSGTPECPYCEPWHGPKPLVETPRLTVRLVVNDDMYRYVQVLQKGFLGWRESALEPIDECPICGKEV